MVSIINQKCNSWEQRKLSFLTTMHARIGWQNLRTSEFLDSGDYMLITGTDFNDGAINYNTCHYVEKVRYEQDRNIQVHKRFFDALQAKRELVQSICGQDFATSDKDLPKYHHKIDESKIKIIEKIEEDYKRRQGNLVLNLCKFIKPEYFERKESKKYKTNDDKLKRRLNISKRNVGRRLDRFFLTFGKDSQLLERDFSRRLQEIEEEIEKERKEQNAEAAAQENNKGVKGRN